MNPEVGTEKTESDNNLSTTSTTKLKVKKTAAEITSAESTIQFPNTNNNKMDGPIPLPRISYLTKNNTKKNKASSILPNGNVNTNSTTIKSISSSVCSSSSSTSASSTLITTAGSNSSSKHSIISNGHGPKKKFIGSGGQIGLAKFRRNRGTTATNPSTTTTMTGNTSAEEDNNIIDHHQQQQPCSSTSQQQLSKRQIFLDIVKQSNLSCQNGDFNSAVKLYTKALKSDPNNHILYSNRSAALIKLGYFNKALQDAFKAAELYPKWPKAYYRQGVALQCLGKHADAIAAFSNGLAEDSKSGQLLAGLIEASVKSPLKGKLEPTLFQLNTMKLTKSPFVVISVIGQELLAEGFYSSAATVLENALRIGTNNIKLNGSVLSALSSAYWALNSLDKAINYMQQDLAIAKTLGDVVGECRAHGNLGSAYFTKANYKDALTSHRYQLVLAMKCKDTSAATSALTSLGHVYTAIGDYANALASHKQCVQLVQQLGNKLQEAREIGNVGAVYLVMGDFSSAIDCHLEHLRLAKELGNKIEEARAYSNLGSTHHYQRNFEQAINFHNQVLQIAHELSDQSIEARAYAGLGHAARCMDDLSMAKLWHEKQLDMALATKDKLCEGRACSNLGIIYQLFNDYESALKLHQVHLSISNQLFDRAGIGRAYGNIGNAYNGLGYYQQAIKYYKKELNISKEVNDKSSEGATHGNLAIAFQALGFVDKALVHYHSHLNISRELKEFTSEACALLNLGNCHSSIGDYKAAIPYYESYLMLSQELADLTGEERGCHLLGYLHYLLGNFKEAVRYYNQDLILAKELNSKANVGRAYCNLGLTYLAIGNINEAIECQTCFLTIAENLKDLIMIFRALSNLGNIFIKMDKIEEALNLFQKGLILAKAGQNKSLQAAAYGSLGMIHRIMKKYNYALGFHKQELSILNETNDLRGQCRANGNLASVHMSLGHYQNAIKNYEEMLIKAQQLDDNFIEAQAYGNLGIARMNLGNYEDAATYFEQQLIILESITSSNNNSNNNSNPGGGLNSSASSIIGIKTGLSSSSSSTNNTGLLQEKCQAYINLGDCFTVLCDYKEAIRYHQKGLEISINTSNSYTEEKCTRAIAFGYKGLGNIEQTIHWLERRLAVTLSICPNNVNSIELNCNNSSEKDRDSTKECESELESQSQSQLLLPSEGDLYIKLIAYQELGLEYQNLLGNYEQAISCFQQQLNILLVITELNMKSSAPTTTPSNHHQHHQHHKSNNNNNNNLKYKQLECETCFNIAQCHVQLGNYPEALKLYETTLTIGTELNSIEIKLRSFKNLGQVHEKCENYESALVFYEQNLNLATQIIKNTNNHNNNNEGKEEEEQLLAFSAIGRLHYILGNQIQARAYLQEAIHLVEKINHNNNSNKNVLNEEQASIQYFLGLVLWKQNELESAKIYLESASKLLESLQQEILFKSSSSSSSSKQQQQHPSLGYSLHLYDRQIACYQTLQRILVSLGKIEDTLLIAEKCRTIANSVLYHHQQQTKMISTTTSSSSAAAAGGNGTGGGPGTFFRTISTSSSIFGSSHQYYEVKSSNQSLININHGGDSASGLYSIPYHNSAAVASSIPIQLINTVDSLLQRINRHKTAALYYSVNGPFLFAWLLIPDRGIVKFHQFSVNEITSTANNNEEEDISQQQRQQNNSDEEDDYSKNDVVSNKKTIASVFSLYIQNIRTALGIDYKTTKGSHTGENDYNNSNEDLEEENDGLLQNDLWTMHMDELGDRLNHEHDRTGFLRMISRNHRFNCSSYSLSSLFSVGSTTGSVKSVPGTGTATNNASNGHNNRAGSTRSCKIRSSRGVNNNNSTKVSSLSSSSSGNINNGDNCSSLWQQHHNQNKTSSSSIRTLYQILIAPFDEELNVLDKTCFRELYLVLDTELLLIPFGILRNSPTDQHFYERFKLIVIPSISSIKNNTTMSSSSYMSTASNSRSIQDEEAGEDFKSSLVVGAPTLPLSITEQWNWSPIPRAENEATMVSELLQPSWSFIGPNATKDVILNKICTAKVIHFATHISWRLSGIVFAPTANPMSRQQQQQQKWNKSQLSPEDEEEEDNNHDGIPSDTNLPPILSDYLLTAADILKLRLEAKLVVLSSYHTRDTQSILHSEALSSICRALLASGVGCILIPLWPVPEIASKIFYRSFYSSLLQGTKVSCAFSEAISTVQHTKHFAHPANWSGYLLIGSDIRLKHQSTFTNTAIWEILKLIQPQQQQERIIRDALRVTLHLVEKSLQRITNGQKTAMYTTQKSIENKIGSSIKDWKDVLISVGFRFEPASIDLPAAVFFPQEDIGERLVKCSSILQAILGLPSQILLPLSKIFNNNSNTNSNVEIGNEIVGILRQAIAAIASASNNFEIKVGIKLWDIKACQELLVSLGFDFAGNEENDLTLSFGPNMNFRLLQFTLEATLSLCEAFTEMDSAHNESDENENENLDYDQSIENLNHILQDVNIRCTSSSPEYYCQQRGQKNLIGSRPTVGGGAFTSFVRSRGEPDGHTNLATEIPSLSMPTMNTNSATKNNPMQFNVYGLFPNNKKLAADLVSRRNVGTNHSQLFGKLVPPSSTTTTENYSSSESSTLDWESSTVCSRKTQQQNQQQQKMFNSHQEQFQQLYKQKIPFNIVSYENQYQLNKSLKHVTWNMTENSNVPGPQVNNNNSNTTNTTNWVPIRIPTQQTQKKKSQVEIIPSIISKPSSSHQQQTTSASSSSKQLNPMNHELPISDVYHERNLNLDLAPSLSKLILANQITLGELIEDDGDDIYNNKTDIESGAMSMDDTINCTFDHLSSMAEDSAPENSTTKVPIVERQKKLLGRFPRIKAKTKNTLIPPIPLRRTVTGPKNGQEQNSNTTLSPYLHHNPGDDGLHSSINLVKIKPTERPPVGGNVIQSQEEESSSNSSKSSPSDLSRRDEGDGRSLTDSQYGSYSPSMVQNTVQSSSSSSTRPLHQQQQQQQQQQLSIPSIKMSTNNSNIITDNNSIITSAEDKVKSCTTNTTTTTTVIKDPDFKIFMNNNNNNLKYSKKRSDLNNFLNQKSSEC